MSGSPISVALRESEIRRANTMGTHSTTLRKPVISPGRRGFSAKLGRLNLAAGRSDLADADYAQAASLLSESKAPIELAHLLQERGHLAFRMGDQSAAARWADDALSCLRHGRL